METERTLEFGDRENFRVWRQRELQSSETERTLEFGDRENFRVRRQREL